MKWFICHRIKRYCYSTQVIAKTLKDIHPLNNDLKCPFLKFSMISATPICNNNSTLETTLKLL